MTEPTTTNIGLTVPNTGDLAGAWGTAALNPNFQIVDGMFGGVLNLSFSSGTTIVLSTNGASITPSAGPFQANNSLIKVSGALSGNAIIECPIPGVYRVLNNCTNTNSFGVGIIPLGGGGQWCGCPPGELRTYLYDGTNVYFTDMPNVGSFNMFGIQGTPNWFNLTTIKPWLVCDGTIYSVASFPALGAMLGAAFGGDGVTTFGVPDCRGRTLVSVDGTGRITGVMGGNIGNTGGDQWLQAHNHSGSGNVSDPGHFHQPAGGAAFIVNVGGGAQIGGGGLSAVGTTDTKATGISVPSLNINASGAGGQQNIQPSIVGGYYWIKT